MSIAIETPIHFRRAKAGRKQAVVDPDPAPLATPERIPRISRLMALAIHFEGLIRKGTVRDYADLARLGGVSRARITQIMNLLNLPPWKQEELLFLKGGRGRSALAERNMRQASASMMWSHGSKPTDQTLVNTDRGHQILRP